MSDAELRLAKRRKTTLVKDIRTNIFVAIDGYDEQRKVADANVDDDVVRKLKGLLKTLERVVTELTGYNDKIYELTTDDAAFEAEMDADMVLSRTIDEYKGIVETMFEHREKAVPAAPVKPLSNQENKTATRRAKVPDLKIPTFAGSFLEWDTFKETFDAIIGDKEDYTNVEKFQYLTAHLSGAAKQCIAGFPVIGDNYAKA